MRSKKWLVTATSLALFASLLPAPTTLAATPVSVVLNGQQLNLSPAAFIQNDRTLVPLRGVFEAMGAIPQWNGADQTVEVSRGDRYVKLKINQRLACLNPSCSQTAMLDVPAQLINNRTFIPVRFVSTALGVDVAWDQGRQTVVINTSGGVILPPPDPKPAPVTLEGVTAGQRITGPISLKASGLSGSQVFFYLIDPTTQRGRLVAAGADVGERYTYTPDPTYAGQRELMAAIRDSSGTLRYSNRIPVNVQPDTQLRVTGLESGSIPGPVTIGHQLNFVATHVVYRLLGANGQQWDLATLGPGESFTWYPHVSFNGPKQVQVLAYDRNGTEYRSQPVSVTVNSDYRTNFSSVSEGESLTSRARMLTVSANYEIKSVRYLLDGKLLSADKEFWWTFGPEMNGAHTLTAEVTDSAGVVRKVGPISFRIDAQPGLWLYGIGPNQLVREELSLMAMPNVPANKIKFFLREGNTDILLGEVKPGQNLAWKPTSGGAKMLYAQAWQDNQWVASTAPIYFQAYLGETYGPRPVVEKSQFKAFASDMALKSLQETGMSAALQVAQAILETGWGQYVPVDKYSGQFSNNLFGIKGSGSAGSIISTTWEVYNGQSYTVDANFRAYNSPLESWHDHKDLLLTRSWYAPFRAVMTDPVLGAWGLRKSGYATDPNYPVKLINIMRDQDLYKLDEVQF